MQAEFQRYTSFHINRGQISLTKMDAKTTTSENHYTTNVSLMFDSVFHQPWRHLQKHGGYNIIFWENIIYRLREGRDACGHNRFYFKLYTEGKLVRMHFQASFSENILIKC